MSDSGRNTIRRTNFASVGAVASALAASSCCLPLLPFVAAAGVAGGSALLATLRPYLLGASVLLIAYGFYQSRRAKQCNCRPSLVTTILLWSSTAIVVVMTLFPQAVAAMLAG
jgi:mercuric ion transport protein